MASEILELLLDEEENVVEVCILFWERTRCVIAVVNLKFVSLLCLAEM